ncbi:MAG TPA: hypothetical protein VJV79_07455 [Polyangiaceae bacterium]|nr:hypothetical protein [Polyangiaceae bacterium]
MRAIRKISLLLALFAVQSLAHSASAREATESWEVSYQRCQDLIRDGDYKSALAACEQAYASSQQPRILPLIARIETALLHPAQAYEALLIYLSGPLDERIRKATKVQVSHLESLIATLQVTTPIQGAQIRMDDQAMDPASLARGELVSAGAHRLTLEAKGETFSRLIFLPARERTRIELPGSGSIALSCAIPQVRLFIDDQEFDANAGAHGVARAAGSHRVVLKVGAAAWLDQQVMVAPDERVSVFCTPAPATPAPATPAPSPADQRPAMDPRGYWVTGVGLSLGVATLVTAIYNGSEFDRWQAANESLRGNQLPFDDWKSRADENNQLMHDIQTRRKVTIGLGVAAALVTAGGVTLLFTDSARARHGSSSWLRKMANGVTVDGGVSFGEIAWRGAW